MFVVLYYDEVIARAQVNHLMNVEVASHPQIKAADGL